MSLVENIRLALNGLTINKLRAFLTMLGIIIGVAAVITLVSVGRGVEDVVTSEFAGLGNNLLFVFPGQFTQNGPPQPLRAGGGLTMDDVAAVSDRALVRDVFLVVPEYSRPAVVSHGREDTRTTVTGSTPEYVTIRDFNPSVGSFFSEQDIQNSTRVAVIGQTVYEELFPDGGLPLGETIRINDVNFIIIGVMEEKGGSGFNDQDDLILVPLSTAQRRLFPARRADGKFRVDLIYAQINNEERQDAAITEIELALRESHRLGLGDEDDFTILSQADLVSAFGEVTALLTVFLAVIASISLLVGGIGIMNIMLVSVTERTREIGLRKAVGAQRRDIMWQFLIEAIVLSLIGGLIGLAIGALGSAVIASLSDTLQPTLAWESVLLAVTFSAAVGLFFGIYPATRAAGLNPIDALRYE